ncbi:MAG: ABC transporter permease subunit, partial [Dehalococcoidia bacterium]
MDLLLHALRDAIRMLVHNESGVYEIAWRTIVVSGTATLLSLVLGVAAGAAIAFRRFPGRLVVLTLVNTGMGFPPVVIGLLVAVMLWRSGPLGELEWIYSKKAMIIAQTIIAAPVVTGFTAAALASLHPRLRLQVYALGASRLQAVWLLLQ